jgi:glutamyl-Q tRNA(Asp) synthetase
VHRNQPGAEAEILRALDAHALHWDGPVTRQSEHLERYEAALSDLDRLGLLFYCSCSRRSLQAFDVYPGTCRGHRRYRSDCAIRVLVGNAEVSFTDLIQGPQQARLASSVGDFIVRRRDGLIAYQLATAVDDGATAITRVVRGSDLLDNTPRQLFLMQELGLAVPAYAHVPTLTHPDGAKLSKQTGAAPLDSSRASSNLLRVLGILGIAPAAADAKGLSPEALLESALARFELGRLPAADVVLR